MATVTISCHPLQPFRLDLTVWALRRRSRNRIDVWDGGYRRVLMVDERPVLVHATQSGENGAELVTLELSASGSDLTPQRCQQAREIVERSLGMGVDLGGFYRLAADDRHLEGLARRFRGLKPPRFPTLFEALANAVACQQLSLEVGIELLNRLALAYGAELDEGRSFPEAGVIAGLTVPSLRRLGFSARKADTLLRIATAIAVGALDEGRLERLSPPAILTALRGIRGIGRWSAEYVLLRGLAHHEVYPGDDVGARNRLRAFLGVTQVLDYSGVQQVAGAWAPYAGMVYFHHLLDGLAARGTLPTLIGTSEQHA